MKHKNNQSKLSKTFKAAIPFFALLGGNGFASNRNFSSASKSRKGKQASVISVTTVKQDISEVLGVEHKAKTKRSAFAAFTNKSSNENQLKQKTNNQANISFLLDNNLLDSNKVVTAQTSGNTLKERGRLSQMHVWNPATNVNTDNTLSSCPNPNAAFWGYYSGSDSCFIYDSLVYTFVTVSTLVACQALHLQCMDGVVGHNHAAQGGPLPVKLLEFKVE